MFNIAVALQMDTSSFCCIDLRSSARVQWLLQALAESEEKSEPELCATTAHLVVRSALKNGCDMCASAWLHPEF